MGDFRKYSSLFEALLEKNPFFPYENDLYLEYESSLETVLDELKKTIVSPARFYDRLKPNESYLIRTLFHPPRVIRAVTDYNIEHPSSASPQELFMKTLDLALSCYRESPDRVKKIDDLKEDICQFDYQLLLQKVKQIADFATLDACNPGLSEDSAHELLDETFGEDVLFIALGHGGVAAGMDVYLRYCDLSGSNDASQFYVVRFSADKHQDKHPRLRKEEIKFLQPLTHRKKIVIFDEDVSTGRTMSKAYDFFCRKVFPGRNLFLLTNLNTSLRYPDLKDIVDNHRLLMGDSEL